MQGLMDAEWLREVCLALPHTTEHIQWGYDLVFKVHGKMFAVAPLEPAPVVLSFKCSEESFAELTERPEVIPAPYMARAKWVALETRDAIRREELAELLRASYRLVFAKLPKRLQQLPQGGGASRKASGKRKPAQTRKRRQR